ncbi:transferase family-domain-containing protein [Stachybotrys elegans]|uniref:Transferase family-domain-containing protein n=1 Tax=Stachybotrys elegans TaxID=80388 RepID=A0A8K0STY7_9HYPO|nr:transferase family-domain-containing protein [Stachybotrys elegans]
MQRNFTFSPVDEIMPHMWMTVLLCFPCLDERKQDVVECLQKALTMMVKERPFLAGTLEKTTAEGAGRKGSLSLKLPESVDALSGALVKVNDLTDPESGWSDSYEELRKANFPPSKLDGSKLSPVAYGVSSETNRVLETQANFIKGGCILAISTCHAFVDGWGYTLILQEWARCCRAVQSGTPDVPGEAAATEDDSRPPGLFVEATSEDYENLKSRQELWGLLGLDWRRHVKTDGDAEGVQVSQPYHDHAVACSSLWTISPEAIAKLKVLANQKPENGWASSQDAVLAMLWRAITRARAPGWTAEQLQGSSMVSVAIDGRRHLTPPVPPSHVGNVVFCCLTWQPVSRLLVAPEDEENALAQVACDVRKSILAKGRNKPMLTDALRLAASIPDLTVDFGNAFTSWLGTDLATSAVWDLPVYHLDFGGIFGLGDGKPEYFRFPRGQFDGLCLMHPKQVNGAVDVAITLFPEEMDRLRNDTVFTSYVKFLAE